MQTGLLKQVSLNRTAIVHDPQNHSNYKYRAEGIADMITGHSPRLEWRPNPDGRVRSIEEALELARRWGVDMPADIEFILDEEGELNEHVTARGPGITKRTRVVLSMRKDTQ